MMLRLFHAPTSPFVRKVWVCAYEKGVEDQIERLASQAWPVKRDPNIVRENPSGKVPAAILDDGSPLFDSRVICAWIDALGAQTPLFPADPAGRFQAMTLEALADAMLDAAMLCRYETVLRPKEFYWALWHDSQMEKIDSGLDDLEARWMDRLRGPLTIGSIATGCALGYLDFRFAEKGWRSGRPTLAAWFEDFAARPSMRATRPE